MASYERHIFICVHQRESSDERGCCSAKGSREVAIPDGAKVLRRERGSGTFERKTALPVEVDVDQVEATLRDGVLTVKLPKVAARRPRKVEIKALKGK